MVMVTLTRGPDAPRPGQYRDPGLVRQSNGARSTGRRSRDAPSVGREDVPCYVGSPTPMFPYPQWYASVRHMGCG